MNRTAWHCGIVLTVLLTSSVVFADPVDDYLNAQMKEHRIPGLAVTVLHNGKRIKTAAYGLANIELSARLGRRPSSKSVHSPSSSPPPVS